MAESCLFFIVPQYVDIVDITAVIKCNAPQYVDILNITATIKSNLCRKFAVFYTNLLFQNESCTAFCSALLTNCICGQCCDITTKIVEKKCIIIIIMQDLYTTVLHTHFTK